MITNPGCWTKIGCWISTLLACFHGNHQKSCGTLYFLVVISVGLWSVIVAVDLWSVIVAFSGQSLF